MKWVLFFSSLRPCSAQVVDESWQGQFSGQLGMLPARVTLSLYFFQETRDKKKLVASLLKLHAYHDPSPEGVLADDGETLIRPKDLSPPACCIIQRHPTKCQETFMEDDKEKTMMIPALDWWSAHGPSLTPEASSGSPYCAFCA